jgi:hypothetical protein
VYWLIAVGNLAVCVESIRVYRGLPEFVPPVGSSPRTTAVPTPA